MIEKFKINMYFDEKGESVEEYKQNNTQKLKSVMQEILSLNNPTPEIMKVIINRIEIHQDKQVDIYLNFRN